MRLLLPPGTFVFMKAGTLESEIFETARSSASSAHPSIDEELSTRTWLAQVHGAMQE